MTNNHSIAHPNPGHYDNRTGLGYGQTQNKFHKQRPVSSGEYGIYSPKGNWDKEIELDKAKKKKKKKSRKSQKLKSKMNKINFSSQFRDATDSLSYRSSNPFSFVDAATALRAHDEIEGHNLLEQFIQESISGNYYIRRSGKGNLYPKHNVVSDKASGQAPSYTVASQYRNHNRTGNRFAARGYTVNKPEEYFLYDDECKDEESTWDKINPDTHDSDKEHIDNIELHIQNILNLT